MSTHLHGDANDIHIFAGTLILGKAVQLPSGSVGGGAINPLSPVPATSLQHQYAKQTTQAHGTAVVARREVLHVALGNNGTLTGVQAALVAVPSGDYAVTIDVRKNGVTVLTAPVVLDSTNTNFVPEAGGVNVPNYVTGDVFETVVTVAGTTGAQGQGLVVTGKFREDAN